MQKPPALGGLPSTSECSRLIVTSLQRLIATSGSMQALTATAARAPAQPAQRQAARRHQVAAESSAAAPKRRASSRAAWSGGGSSGGSGATAATPLAAVLLSAVQLLAAMQLVSADEGLQRMLQLQPEQSRQPLACPFPTAPAPPRRRRCRCPRWRAAATTPSAPSHRRGRRQRKTNTLRLCRRCEGGAHPLRRLASLSRALLPLPLAALAQPWQQPLRARLDPALCHCHLHHNHCCRGWTAKIAAPRRAWVR